MKHTIFILSTFLSILFLLHTVSASEIKVEEVPFDVTVNEQKIINDDEYPLLFYKGIVYLPTTFNMNTFVGLRVEFYPKYDFEGGREARIFIGLNPIETSTYVPYSLTTYTQSAEIQPEIIVVNYNNSASHINNTGREHPVINHKNVLYVPLTYDIAVEKLDWKLSFSSADGLNVDTRSPNRPIWDALHSSMVGFSGAPGSFNYPSYVYNENSYASYNVMPSYKTAEFRYKEVGGEEIRNRIQLPTDGDYFFCQKTTTGTDVYRVTGCVLENGGILKMPVLIKSQINGRYIGRNFYITVDVKNGVVLSLEEKHD